MFTFMQILLIITLQQERIIKKLDLVDGTLGFFTDKTFTVVRFPFQLIVRGGFLLGAITIWSGWMNRE